MSIISSNSQVSVNKVMASLRCIFPVARHVELTNCIACELHVTLTQQPTNITYMRQHIHTLDLVRSHFKRMLKEEAPPTWANVCHFKLLLEQNMAFVGSGCRSVGRPVACDTRGPRFESSHRRTLIHIIINCIEKTKLKKKEAGNGLFYKIHGFLRRI